MGSIKGALTFTGRIGNLVAYERDGKFVIQTKGGPSKEQFYKSSTMARTRENVAEWTAVVKLGKVLRDHLPYLRSASDSTIHGRLQGFLRNFLVEDTSHVRGERRVPAHALKELRHFRSVKGGGPLDRYLSVVKITEVSNGLRFEFPKIEESLFYRPFDSLKFWVVCKHVNTGDNSAEMWKAETDHIYNFEDTERFLELETPALQEGFGRVYVLGIQVYNDGLMLKDKKMNGCVWRGF